MRKGMHISIYDEVDIYEHIPQRLYPSVAKNDRISYFPMFRADVYRIQIFHQNDPKKFISKFARTLGGLAEYVVDAVLTLRTIPNSGMQNWRKNPIRMYHASVAVHQGYILPIDYTILHEFTEAEIQKYCDSIEMSDYYRKRKVEIEESVKSRNLFGHEWSE